jgi:outer membrane lipoprotein SlyB
MFKGTSFWSGVLSGGISQIGDIRSYMKGEILTQDFGVHTTSNVTGAVGIMASHAKSRRAIIYSNKIHIPPN